MKSFNQIPFSRKIRWRIRALWCLLLVMLIYMVVVGELGWGDSRIMTSLASDVSRTIFFGGMIWVVFKIRKNKRLLSEPSLLKEKMVTEKDERNQYLHDKSGGIVWDILFAGLLFTTLTTSLISMPAFYTSLAVLIFSVLLKAVAYCVYSRMP